MLICFEGPSAIGKTTMCESLSEQFNIVPEANVLFEKGNDEDPLSYLKLQVKRYERSLPESRPSVLDGDIFQPLWYNWTYNFPEEHADLDTMTAFYSNEILLRKIKFPDLYIVFFVEVAELKLRKVLDVTRSRRNFDKHLILLDSQKKYFEFVSQNTSIPVELMYYNDFQVAREQVLTRISSTTTKKRNDIENLLIITDMLKKERFK